MAVAHDTSSSNATGSSGSGNPDQTTATLSFTGTSGAALIVTAHLSVQDGNLSSTVISATYGGTTVPSIRRQAPGSNTAFSECFALLNACDGSAHNIVISVTSGNNPKCIIIGASSYTDAGAFDVVSSAPGISGNSGTLLVGCGLNDMVHAAAAHGDSISGVGTGGTQRWSQNVDANSAGANAMGGTWPAANTTVSEAFTSGSSDHWVLIGVTVVSASAPTPRIVSSANAALSASRSPSLAFTAAQWVPKENDVVVLVPSSTDTAAITLPSGWVNTLGGTTDVESDAHEECCVYHLVTAAEQSGGTTTYTATNLYDATETGNVVGCVVRGVDPASVIDSANSTFDSSNNVTPHVLASLTGTNLSTGSLVLSCVAKDGTGTYTTPTGWTQVQTQNTNQGKWLGVRNTLTTADTNVTATNITPSAGDEYVSITIALTKVPAGGTQYEANLSGSITPAGIITKSVLITRIGTVTPSGVLSKQPQKLLTSSISSITGILLKEVQQSLSGSVTPTGTLSLIRIILMTLTGSITPTGVLVKDVSIIRAGLITPVGAVSKEISVPKSGSITSIGALANQAQKSLSGSISSSGTFIQTTQLAKSASIATTGTLTQQTQKLLVGTSTPAGAIAKLVSKPLIATITPTGSISLIRVVLMTFTGTITPVGNLLRQTQKSHTASISTTGNLLRQTQKNLTASITPTGNLSLIRVVLMTFTGSITPVGNLLRQTQKTLPATITPSSTLTRAISKTLAGTLTPTGFLRKLITRTFTGVIASIGSLVTVITGAEAPIPGIRILYIEDDRLLAYTERRNTILYVETSRELP